MSNLSLTSQQQERMTDTIVNAVQILYASVNARKEKEFVEKLNGNKNLPVVKTITRNSGRFAKFYESI